MVPKPVTSLLALGLTFSPVRSPLQQIHFSGKVDPKNKARCFTTAVDHACEPGGGAQLPADDAHRAAGERRGGVRGRVPILEVVWV